MRVQQDAQEFLNLGFDRLEHLLKDTPQKYLCQNVFQGQSASLTICKSCGNIVQTDEDFYTLQVTVKNKPTLKASLESMIAGEMIEDYNCSACLKKVTIEKKSCLKSLPNTLIVHLNRIVFDFDSMRNLKLNDKLEFPNELNLREYMLAQVLADVQRKQQEEAHPGHPDGAPADEVVREENHKLEEDEVAEDRAQPDAPDGGGQAAVQPNLDEQRKQE